MHEALDDCHVCLMLTPMLSKMDVESSTQEMTHRPDTANTDSAP
jgi:hypothetical protein